jgi:hypothetical protein
MQIKKLIAIIIFTSPICTGFGQSDSISISIIKDIIIKTQDTTKILYVDSIIYFRSVDALKDLLKKRNFSWKYDHINNRQLIITKSELSFIIDNLNALKIEEWNDNIFENSMRIPADSLMHAAISINDYKTPASIRKYKYVWHFSKPILIRNNTIAFVQYAYICGPECGNEEIAFYKKMGDRWTKWVLIGGGEF